MPCERGQWTIGFLAPLVHGYFWGNVLTGVLRTAAQRGGRVIAIQTFDAGLVDFPDDDRFTTRLAWQHLDALVVGHSAVTPDYLREFAATGKPVVPVYWDLGPDNVTFPTVVPDNQDGIRQVVAHLVEHGHTRIAFVGRTPTDADDRLRYQAYREAMVANRLTARRPVMMPWQLGRETFDTADAIRQLQDRGSLPTAVVAGTDLVALALVEALTAAGHLVPEDVAVVGFDDIADAAGAEPPLSTVAQDFALAGTVAGGLVFDALEGSPPRPGQHRTPVTFVARRSCGCADAAEHPTAPTPPDGTRLHDALHDALVDAVDDERRAGASRRHALAALAEGLTALFTAAARAPADGSGTAADTAPALIGELRRLATESSNPLRVISEVRRAALGLAAQVAPDDVAAAARCEHLAFDIAIRMLADRHLNLLGRPVAYQNFEAERRHFLIGTDLVRRSTQVSQSLDWLAATELRAGCLALWEGGRGSGRGGTGLRIVGVYDKVGRYRTAVESCDVAAFPPRSFVDLLDEQDDEHRYLYLMPVRFAGSDWGFLALTGPLDVREVALFERYNHWVVLLTVALDHEHAIQSEHALLEEIRTSEERYALAAEAANDGLWDWNVACGTVFYSSRWKSLLGCAEDEVGASSDEWLRRVHPDDRPAVDQMLALHFQGRASTTELECRLLGADGTYRWMLTHCRSMRDEAGGVSRLIGSMTDITDRKSLEERLRHDAHFDPLSGLPNRTLFLSRLEQAIERAEHQPGYAFAVVFVDLDGFKVINDSLGHQIGDEVLVRVAQRLVQQLRPDDMVSRFGGDEYVLLLDNLRDAAGVPAMVTRILSVISAPLTIGDRVLTVTAGAGIAASTTGYATAVEYLRDADTAMYRAKAIGNGSFVVFDRSMHVGAVRRLQIESDLRQAIADGQFELYYQPIFRLRDRRMVGSEALIRWHRPEQGMISPGEFLPVAETTGLIRDIGRWTIRDVCRQLRCWLDAFPDCRDLAVSVNLSNRQFWDSDLLSYVHEAMDHFDVPASMIVFEVTEGVIMHNQDAATTLMRRLRDDGFVLHMDDFGTGHSSLAALHRFPIDALKIDRSFVVRMRTDARSRELVRIMIDIGRSLGIEVIAEGIEVEREAAILSDLGCSRVQGYLFARPVPASELPRFFPSSGWGLRAAS